jgi:hypothetical protein
MLAQGIVGLEHPIAKSIFLIMPDDNSFKRHRKMLETNALRNNHLKDKATKYIRI